MEEVAIFLLWVLLFSLDVDKETITSTYKPEAGGRELNYPYYF